MNIRFYKALLAFVIALYPLCTVVPIMPFNLNKKLSTTLPIISTVELKTSYSQELVKNQEAFKQRKDQDEKKLTDTIEEINQLTASIKKDLPSASDYESGYFNRKLTLLNERKSILTTIKDEYKKLEDAKNKHLQVIYDFILFLQHLGTQKKELKAIYSWKEARDFQIKIGEHEQKLDQLRKQRDELGRQRDEEKTTLAPLEKQLEGKEQEKSKLLALVKSPDAPGDIHKIKGDHDLIVEELNLLQEKLQLRKFKIEVFEQFIQLKDAEVEFLEHQISQKKDLLSIIEKNVVLDVDDVELARVEANVEYQKAARIKESLDKIIETRKVECDKLGIETGILQNQLKKFEDKATRDEIIYYKILSQFKKTSTHLTLIERELDLLSIKKEQADILATYKEVSYKMVSLKYSLRTKDKELEDILSGVKSQKALVKSQIKTLEERRDGIMQAFVTSSRESESIKHKEEKTKQLNSVKPMSKPTYDSIIQNFQAAQNFLQEQLKMVQEYLAINSDVLMGLSRNANQYDLMIKNINQIRHSEGRWKRSSKAITLEEFVRSLLEAEEFFKQIFWDTPAHFGPGTLLNQLRGIRFKNIFIFLFTAFFFAFLFLLGRKVLFVLLARVRRRLATSRRSISFLYCNLAISLFEFLIENFILLFSWCFISLHIACNFRYIFSSLKFLEGRYYLSLFYLGSIVLFIYLARRFVVRFKELNQKLSFLFFAEKFQDRFLLLISSCCYSTAILIPLRKAFLAYYPTQQTVLPDVIIAAYTLILVIVALLFFSKEDVQKLVPSSTDFMVEVKRYIDKHYYPVFFFLTGLLILANPYIGYSNLAWFLAWAIPSTMVIVYVLLLGHRYIRKYAFSFFMTEEDDEIVDKFEHAKTYYGFFVIFSLIILVVGTFILIARMWGYSFSLLDIWKILADDLAIPIRQNEKLGFVQLLSLVTFIATGFLLSSIADRFMLQKFFDILRTEPGTQNTVSRMLHYTILSLSVLIGFMFIGLEQVIWFSGTFVAAGAALALKDLFADYISGVFVLLERPIEIGSYIRVDKNPDLQGTVQKIDARTTTIMTKLKHSVIIPNRDLVSKVIANWGKGRFAVAFEITILVDYYSSPEKVRMTLLEVVQNHPMILRAPSCIVRLENFEECSLSFLVRAFISSRRVREQWTIAGELRESIFVAFKENGIKFAYPQQRVIHIAGKSQPKNGPIDIVFDQADPPQSV